MKKGFWTLEDLRAAKRLVRDIVDLANTNADGSLDADNARRVVIMARSILADVRANRPAEMELPL